MDVLDYKAPSTSHKSFVLHSLFYILCVQPVDGAHITCCVGTTHFQKKRILSESAIKLNMPDRVTPPKIVSIVVVVSRIPIYR